MGKTSFNKIPKLFLFFTVIIGTIVSASVANADNAILFSSDRDGGGIYIMNVDVPGQIIRLTNNANDGSAHWSPDGKKIVFASNRDGNLQQIYLILMNADRTELKLTDDPINHPGNNFDPFWSPDGTKIAFRTDRDGNEEIYMMNADGTNPINLTNDPARDGEPKWSPDGTRILFSSWRSGEALLYVMDADGLNQKPVPTAVPWIGCPMWSPDGTKIAYTGLGHVYIANADGSNPVNITNDSTRNWLASWSPDGKKLLFSSDRTGNYDIYTMNVGGSDVVNLTNDSTNEYASDWSPVPVSMASIKFLDASDFSIGNEVTNDPQKLVVDTANMDGAVTDGVSRLLLRIEVNDFNPVTFFLQGESNNPQDENGFLQSIDNQESQQKNQSLTVSPIAIGDKKYVFAVYRAPSNFVRHDIDKNQDGVDDDTIISERIISLTAQINGQPIATKDIKLERPPLILIHGLWSSKFMWNNPTEPIDFERMLKAKIPDIVVYTDSYPNDVYFGENREAVRQFIQNARDVMNSKGIAMIQADIVGHSMGGVLARIWAGAGTGYYVRDDNFRAGDIHKLITLDSPHYGSFLADLGVLYLRDPGANSIVRTILVETMQKRGYNLTNGAIYNLMSMSNPIK